ncbi:MAG TPA: DNA gyrase C-terminal beta-propeller domain-containing protein, partial [Phycisphaerae bacterium]|nr:DNA gyrase C-terminal beta-propeller domain-containing protein [Phycisphaerae bacterium]
GTDEIVLCTANGQAIRFKETDVRPMGRTAAGVRGVHLRKGHEVVDMAIFDLAATLLSVCENGYGKRTSFKEYRIQHRGGYGIINIKTTERNGKVVGMKSMREADELMLITSGGMIVRTGVSELRSIGRATQGVRVIALKPGDKLVSVARVAAEEAAQEQGEGEPGSAPQPAVEPPAETPQAPAEKQAAESAEKAAEGPPADSKRSAGRARVTKKPGAAAHKPAGKKPGRRKKK